MGTELLIAVLLTYDYDKVPTKTTLTINKLIRI